GLVVAALYALGAGLLVGIHLLGTEALDGNLGFYLSLPISTGRLWGVRVMAAWITLVLSVVLVAIPALLSWAAIDRLDAFGISDELGYAWVSLGILVGLPPVVLVLGHVLGLAARARTLWLGVDVVGLLVVAGLVGWSGAVLLGLGAWEEAVLAGALFGLLSLLVLGFGGWRQLDGGRSDVGRLARLGALWLWGLLGIGAVGITGLSVWWLTVTPSDLTRIQLYRAGPDTAYVTGDYRWRPSYSPLLLIRGEGEEFLRFPGFRLNRIGDYGVAQSFSADGSVGLIRGQEHPFLFRSSTGEIEVQPLGNLPRAQAMTLDAEGDRLALALEGRIVLAEGPDWVPTGELRVPGGLSARQLRFDDDRLTWIGHGRSALEIQVGDLREESVHRLEIPVDLGRRDLRFELGPRGALAVIAEAKELEIWDVGSAERIAELERRWPFVWRFTPDGSVVVLEPAGSGDSTGRARLRIYRSPPGPLLDTVLEEGRVWGLGGGTEDGRLILVAHGSGMDGLKNTRLVGLDPESGGRTLLADVDSTLVPAANPSDELWPGGLWLEERETETYWLFDPAHDELRRIFPKS
ncbi:MAG: hypothetical protein R3234_10215, partial [Thermoanaerobaculia bacterium]|nr:hypothetical protein [Thermoanaerobaculia bacterium]